MWFSVSAYGIHGVDFGRFGLKGSHKTRSLNENENDQDGCCYPLRMIPPRLHEHRGSQVFLEQTEPERKKPTVLAPKKEISIII